MKIAYALIALLALAASPLAAKIVRPAPDVAFAGSAGKISTLKSLRGQPAVIVFGRNARDGQLRKQIAQLENLYRKFAAREVVFLAATADGQPVKSDIPFVQVADGPGAAAAYGIAKSGIAIVGKDGNLDLVSAKLYPAERVKEVLDNSYPVQSAQRKN